MKKGLRSKVEVQYIASQPMYLYWNEIVLGVWTLMGMSPVQGVHPGAECSPLAGKEKTPGLTGVCNLR